MMKYKNLLLVLLFVIVGCVEKDLVPGNGDVALSYDWTKLTNGTPDLSGMVAYVYPVGHKGEVVSLKGEELKRAFSLSRGEYRLLTFNQNAERISYTELSDFDQARASLKPLDTKAGGHMLLPIADWLYGGTVTDLRVDGRNSANPVAHISPYVRRIHVEVKTDVTKIESASGRLTNTAIGINLKDGKPAPVGNGTTLFDLKKSKEGLVADFMIFGVDSSSWEVGKDLKNIMNVTVVDDQGNVNELEVDISSEISGGIETGGEIEEEMTGIGIVRITVDGWESDDEDHSLTETPIRLAAYVGIPVKATDRAFTGEYGVTVEKNGSTLMALYTNNKVSVDAGGNTLFSEEMYYPLGFVNLYAYAPYRVEVPVSWTLTGNMATDDLLWAKLSGVAESKNEVSLHFGHLLSALRVELVRGTNVSETELENLVTRICNTVTTAKLDMKAGSAVADNVDVTEFIPQVSEEVVSNGLALETCIVPQTVSTEKVFIYVKVTDDLVYTYKPAIPLVFEPGKRKVIRLTLNNGDVNLLTKTQTVPRLEVQIREENF